MARCKKHGKSACLLCAGTFGKVMFFPVEHALWEKAPVFASVTRALGLA